MKHLKSYKLFEGEEETYSFEELSPEAQEKALDNNRDLNIDYDGWEDGVTEGFKEDMKEIGIDDIEINYTGFNSQGDGASFKSDDIDKTEEKYAKNDILIKVVFMWILLEKACFKIMYFLISFTMKI